MCGLGRAAWCRGVPLRRPGMAGAPVLVRVVRVVRAETCEELGAWASGHGLCLALVTSERRMWSGSRNSGSRMG